MGKVNTEIANRSNYMLNGICTVHLSADLAFNFLCIIASDCIPVRPSMLPVRESLALLIPGMMENSRGTYLVAIAEPKGTEVSDKDHVAGLT